MARSKSTSGGKGSRSKQEQTGDSKVALPEGNAVAAETTASGAPPETKLAAKPRKLAMVKTELRKNVLPINLEDEIRRRAYELYLQRGNASGSEAEDWLTAEREVRQRYQKQQSA